MNKNNESLECTFQGACENHAWFLVTHEGVHDEEKTKPLDFGVDGLQRKLERDGGVWEDLDF